MAGTAPVFEIDDTKTFDENFEAFGNEMQALDAKLGPVLKTELLSLVAGTSSKTDVWNALLAAAAQKDTS
jgi:hypothetical protein